MTRMTLKTITACAFVVSIVGVTQASSRAKMVVEPSEVQAVPLKDVDWPRLDATCRAPRPSTTQTSEGGSRQAAAPPYAIINWKEQVPFVDVPPLSTTWASPAFTGVPGPKGISRSSKPLGKSS